MTGWTYWLFWVVTGMAETTAAAVYVKFWAPGIPQWLSALTFLVILYGANLISVKLFGEIEFWFSMVKVTAIIGMILIGIGVLTLGFSDAGDTASITHLWDNGGFFPKGIGATVMTLQIVMFAYLGVELVGVTAGESENPQKTLPRAINTLPWRIALFYIGALVIILSLVPWTEFQPGVSPFVAAFGKIGIPAAAGIINFVVLTAALSSCNSGMYSTGRMLRDLALRGQAPGRLHQAQLPPQPRRRDHPLLAADGRRMWCSTTSSRPRRSSTSPRWPPSAASGPGRSSWSPRSATGRPGRAATCRPPASRRPAASGAAGPPSASSPW